VKQFLLLCKKFKESTNELRKKAGRKNMRKENLLGDPKLGKDTLEFVEKMRKFNFDKLIEFGINRLENTFQRERGRKRWIRNIFSM